MKYKNRGWYGYSYPEGFIFIPIDDSSLSNDFELVELKIAEYH